jgi:hypothetical protein
VTSHVSLFPARAKKVQLSAPGTQPEGNKRTLKDGDITLLVRETRDPNLCG